MNKQETRHLLAATNYAAADKSDPFTLARILTHLGNGVAKGFSEKGDECLYTATPTMENRRLQNGTVYQVTVYKDMARP